MAESFELEKWIWTEEDFERMGWHDAVVHAIAYLPEDWEFLLDIDYIFQWVHPTEQGQAYQFWTTPATLVFADVANLQIDLAPMTAVEIEDVTRSDPQSRLLADGTTSSVHWLWTIDCQQGQITFRSSGFTQWIRRPALLNTNQSLTQHERDGLSFARTRLA